MHWNRDKNKAKSHNPSPTHTNQPQTQVSQKNKRHRSCQEDYTAIEINVTEVAKKDKNKTKDSSYIKYYT